MTKSQRYDAQQDNLGGKLGSAPDMVPRFFHGGIRNLEMLLRWPYKVDLVLRTGGER